MQRRRSSGRGRTRAPRPVATLRPERALAAHSPSYLGCPPPRDARLPAPGRRQRPPRALRLFRQQRNRQRRGSLSTAAVGPGARASNGWLRAHTWGLGRSVSGDRSARHRGRSTHHSPGPRPPHNGPPRPHATPTAIPGSAARLRPHTSHASDPLPVPRGSPPTPPPPAVGARPLPHRRPSFRGLSFRPGETAPDRPRNRASSLAFPSLCGNNFFLLSRLP